MVSTKKYPSCRSARTQRTANFFGALSTSLRSVQAAWVLSGAKDYFKKTTAVILPARPKPEGEGGSEAKDRTSTQHSLRDGCRSKGHSLRYLILLLTHRRIPRYSFCVNLACITDRLDGCLLCRSGHRPLLCWSRFCIGDQQSRPTQKRHILH